MPLTYFYQKYAYPSSDVADLEQLPMTLDELKACANLLVQETMLLHAYTFDSFLGKIADYKNGTLLYSKDDLCKYAEEACAYIAAVERLERDVDTSDVLISGEEGETTFYTQLSTLREDRTLAAFPTIEGGVTANIHAYAAVNRNTSMQEEAFSFLELLCRDEILCGQSFQAGEDMKMCEMPYLLCCHSVNTNVMAISYPELSEENRESLETLDGQITAVRFYSEIEQELRDMFRLYFQSYWKGEKIEVREELLSKTYDAIEMKVLE